MTLLNYFDYLKTDNALIKNNSSVHQLVINYPLSITMSIHNY